MITINLLDVLFWLMGVFAINGILPDNCKEDLGGIIHLFLQIIWVVLCVAFLGVFGYDIKIVR